MKNPTQALIDAVDKHWSSAQGSGHRRHLGASVIGKHCVRHIWYVFWWAHAVKHSGRLLRLFDRGKREEERMVQDLRSIGAIVKDVDPETGTQFKVSTLWGLFGGETDGELSNLEEYGLTGVGLLEGKTHSVKSFKALKDKGLWSHKPEHAVQMQVYMGLRGYEWGLYWPVCKDTDELWPVVVPYKHEVYLYHYDRAAHVLRHYAIPPPRISEDPSWYQCKFCDHKRICHEGAAVDKNCRTCKNIELQLHNPESTHTWFCKRWNAAIPEKVQREGCDVWEARF